MGRNAENLKTAILNITNKEVNGVTKGNILENLNLQYVEVMLKLKIVDEDGEAVAGTTAVIKRGATIGSGDTVSAESDGGYKTLYGKYNYSVSKTGYDTKTGVVEITTDDAHAKEKSFIIILTEST